MHALLLAAAADVTPAVAIGPLHRHKRAVVFAQLRARVRARGRARAQQHVEQRRRCNSCARIIADIRSKLPPSPSEAALKSQTSTHLVGVHDNHVAPAAFNNMHDSHEQAVALSLRTLPPVLARPAFVRHAAGVGGCMQRQQLL